MIRQLCLLASASVLTLPLIHPFGPVREQRSENPLPDAPRLAEVCGNCHSERTEWPLYSYLPGVSWVLEKDVAEARAHLNLSRWDRYSVEEKRDLLGRIAAEVRNRQMPPARYTMVHRDALLSDSDIQKILDWTKNQRRLSRNSPGINQASPESLLMPQ